MTKPLNQEEKERLAALKEHIGPMAPNELRQSAEVHREFDPRSQFADQMDDYANLLEREHL
jgi:hypothetical protein